MSCFSAACQSHSKRWRQGATGGLPRGARTRRVTGFSPMRCAAVAPGPGGDDRPGVARGLLGDDFGAFS